MRALAGRLGVEAMSLYHHVAGKDALLDAMVDAVFGELYLPVVGGDWRVELRARSVSGRAVLLRHRWAVGLMDATHPRAPDTCATTTPCSAALPRRGSRPTTPARPSHCSTPTSTASVQE